MSESSNSKGGVGIASLTTLTFVVLKLTHVIAWSWWWVFSPLWIVCALFLILMVIAGIAFALSD